MERVPEQHWKNVKRSDKFFARWFAFFPFFLWEMRGWETEIAVLTAGSSQDREFRVHKEQSKAGLAALGCSELFPNTLHGSSKGSGCCCCYRWTTRDGGPNSRVTISSSPRPISSWLQLESLKSREVLPDYAVSNDSRNQHLEITPNWVSLLN